MIPNWLSTCVYYRSLWLAVDAGVLCVDIRNSFELLFASSSWFFAEFKVKVKKYICWKNFSSIQLFKLSQSWEILSGRRRLIKPIQLLDWFAESVKSFSRSMEKAWTSVTLSEYPCSAISGLPGSSSGANFGIHKSRKDRTLIRYSLWWDLQVD